MPDSQPRDRYSRQKLEEALYHLVSEGKLRERLTRAMLPLNQLAANGSASQAIAAKLKVICGELNQHPATHPGSDHEMPRYFIAPRRAKELAREILSLYTDAQGGLG